VSAFGDLPLEHAAVPATATFGEAVSALRAASVSTIAVVDTQGRVVGLFGEPDVLRGLFPGYLGDLRHTAFAEDDAALLARRAAEVAPEPVTRHMREAVTLAPDTSATHAAERFLHSGFDALPVVENGRFVGMLSRRAFCRLVESRLGSRG
jgi:CBS domain-containing protein